MQVSQKFLRMRFAGISWRKFRPHQCPHCAFASKEETTHNGQKIPRYCEQPPHKPFISPDSTDRNCKHFALNRGKT